MSRPGSGEGEAGGGQSTPEKTLHRMLNTRGISSGLDAANGEEEGDDDEDDEPDLDALATRLSAKVSAIIIIIITSLPKADSDACLQPQFLRHLWPAAAMYRTSSGRQNEDCISLLSAPGSLQNSPSVVAD